MVAVILGVVMANNPELDVEWSVKGMWKTVKYTFLGAVVGLFAMIFWGLLLHG